LIEQSAEAVQGAPSHGEPFRLGGVTVRSGTRATVEIPVPRLLNRAELAMSVKVVHGAKPGPVLLVSAALHGDEVNGVEIILRLLNRISARKLAGTVLAIPVVNVYGFITNSRYLPDRRDLNRSFPGSSSGSLASRLAQLFTDEILSHATHVVDLHTGGLHRSNLPQIRACLDDPRNQQLADAFGAPVVIDAKLREGSLRAAAVNRKMPMIVYEAGEALRLDRTGVLVGVRGIMAVLHSLGMIQTAPTPSHATSFRSTGSSWLRAPASGLFRSECRLGQIVRTGQSLGVINDPLAVTACSTTTP
jgi:predicted deacylase